MTGWIGPENVVTNYLACVGADRDIDGRFLVATDGPEAQPPSSFMGQPGEVVLPGSLVYFVDGKPRPLVANMVATIGQGSDRGHTIVVI